jgi:acyl carrier protein
MTDLANRLVGCFTSVFPDLSAEAAREATAKSLKSWDSVASVTLVTVIEEEFGIRIDAGDIPDLSCFRRISLYVEAKLRGQLPGTGA